MAYAYTHNDPFSDSSNGSREMQAALRDVVTIDSQRKGVPRSNTNNSGLDAYGQDDILAAYGDDNDRDSSSRSRSHSPAKTRTAQPGPPPVSSSTSNPRPPNSSRSKSYGDSAYKSKSKSGSSSAAAAAAAKAKQDLDVIDRLDISGLYGGGGFTRHDGPYAAATASRNKGPRAPMAAFDPSALAPPGALPPSSARPSNPPRGSSKGVSARAQAAMAAMDDHEQGAGHDPLGHPGLGRRLSDSSINMGFPTKGSGKGAQLIEMYGVRDAEAWEDYGRRQYGGGDGSGASSRESVVPPGVSKEDRIERAQSIWDIEATLKAGKPVGQAPPPPVPVMPSGLHDGALYDSNTSSNKPKRSKSLAARLRGGRSGKKAERERESSIEHEREVPPPPLNTRDTNGQYDDQEEEEEKEGPDLPSPLRERGAVRFENEPRYQKGRFEGGEAVHGTRSLGQEGQVESPALSRRPSVMQRLFAGKKKSQN